MTFQNFSEYNFRINIAQHHNELNGAIIEWNRSENELICIVYGYIRLTEIEYNWQDKIPIIDVSNIILFKCSL